MSDIKDLIQLTPKELKELVKSYSINNFNLQQKGHLPNALCIEGEAGLSKTSCIVQVAHEEGMGVAKVNLGALDDLGDLVGFPYKTFRMIRTDEDGAVDAEKWVSEQNLPVHQNLGWELTADTRTDYAPPKWVTMLNKERNLLILDDYSRADQRFLQACMELIESQEYYGWKLPPGTTIVLTGNPAGGDYFVNESDVAQTTRYFKFGIKFSINDWAEHAERVGIDGRSINFMIAYWDQVLLHSVGDNTKQGLKSNPRQWTKFFTSIAHIDDYNSPESLAEIQRNGYGIVGDLVNVYTTFINRKLDKLVSPEKMLLSKDGNAVIKEMKDVVGTIGGESYNSAVASILGTRLSNFSVIHSESNPITDEICDRLELIAEEKVFGDDINWKIYRDVFAGNKNKFKKLIYRPFFAKYMA